MACIALVDVQQNMGYYIGGAAECYDGIHYRMHINNRVTHPDVKLQQQTKLLSNIWVTLV